jgi:hypothetical protein
VPEEIGIGLDMLFPPAENRRLPKNCSGRSDRLAGTTIDPLTRIARETVDAQEAEIWEEPVKAHFSLVIRSRGEVCVL